MLGSGINFDHLYTDQRDGPDVRELRMSRPRAREPHKCVMCGELIKVGERYTRTVSIDYDQGGKFCSDAWHGGVCPLDMETE